MHMHVDKRLWAGKELVRREGGLGGEGHSPRKEIAAALSARCEVLWRWRLEREGREVERDKRGESERLLSAPPSCLRRLRAAPASKGYVRNSSL